MTPDEVAFLIPALRASFPDEIAAIEAESAAAERARIVAAIGLIDAHFPYGMYDDPTCFVEWKDVLAAIEGESK